MLKKLWTDGLSASQIAAELGGITRNAVIGKVPPAGPVRPRQVAVLLGAAGPRKPRPHMMRVPRPSMRGNTALALAFEMEPEPEAELIENIIPIGQRRTLLELNEDTCRWPIGDPASPEFFFCGGTAADGLPYCSYHSRVAYQPGRRPPQPQAAVPAALSRPSPAIKKTPDREMRPGVSSDAKLRRPDGGFGALLRRFEPAEAVVECDSRRRGRCGSDRHSRPRLSALRSRPTWTSTVRSSI